MRLWADIYSADGATRLGKGPVLIQSASVNRNLDGAGSVQFAYPAIDERAMGLVQNKRQARIYSEINDTIRALGQGVIDTIGIDVGDGGYVANAGGPDMLTALTNKSVLLGRIYDDQAISDIVDDLVDLAGWTATVDAGLGNVSARFDGTSVLKALLTLVEQQGLHLREGTSPNTLEVGVFGENLLTDGGQRVMAYGPVQAGHREIQARDNLLLIENFSQVKESESVINWIIPLGAGDGEAALTLAQSTRTEPYTIQSMTGPDGRTLYYLEDVTSIATYGDEFQKIVVFKNIAPVGTGSTDQINAANALYDAAAAWLQRNAVLLKSYSFSCRKPAITVRPGDKIRFRYKGIVELPTGLLTYIDVDEDFWVMRAGESFGPDGIKLNLEVASIDRREQSAAEVIVGALEAIEIRNTAIQSYYTSYGIVYRREIDSTHDAVVPIYVTNAVQAIQRVLVRFTTRPFRATSKGAEAAGAHRHRMFQWGANSGVQPPGAYYQSMYATDDDSGSNGIIIDMAILTNPKNQDLWTFSASDNHVHSLDYGIEDDTGYPDTVSIKVNGVDRTSELGGPWGVGGGAIVVEVDISDYIRSESTLHKTHTVTLECDSGQGEVEFSLEVYEIIQTVAVT